MNKAFYSITNKPIFATDIVSRNEYIKKYSGKIYCPTPGCHAQVDYVELPYSTNSKIFRTHKGSEHILSCPYCITHKTTNAPSFSSETFSQSLSSDHIKSILKGLYQRNTESTKVGSNTPQKSITRHFDRRPSISPMARPMASLDPNATPNIKGDREPSVRKRRSQDLLAEDNHRLRGIDGIVDSATVGDNYIELHFSTIGCPVTLLFYNAFRNKSEQIYQLIEHLAYLLNTSDLNILVCCLGVVEMNDEKATIQIMSPEYITIEGLSISSYMSLKAS